MIDPLCLQIEFLVSGAIICLASGPCDWDLPQLEPLGHVQLPNLVILVCEMATLQLTWLKHLWKDFSYTL